MIKCKWCSKDVELKTYRTIDTITGSSLECKECVGLETKYLIARRDKNEEDKN